MQHLYATEEQYNRLVEDLILMVADSGWTFDTIVCLSRGGLRVGDLFSRVHDMPLAVLAASSYVADAGRAQGELQISGSFAMARGTVHGRVLLLDDLADSGKTLAAVVRWIAERVPGVTEVRTAVLWEKRRSCFHPDYVVVKLASDPWIHQPFERYDAMGLEALRARVAARQGGDATPADA